MRRNLQRVNVGLEKGSEGLVDHPVALQPGLAGESWRDDTDIEVSTAIGRACMARMQVTLILDQKFRWRERLVETVLNQLCPGFSQGSTALNGLTVTRA